MLAAITDNADLERERAALRGECEVLIELMRKMVQENARVSQDQGEYNARYSSLTERYDKARKLLAEVGDQIASRNARQSELEGFLKMLEDRKGLLTEFDESLWMGIVHQMKIDSSGGFTFVLKNGSKMPFVRAY